MLERGWTGIVFKNEWEFPVYMELGYDGARINNSGAVEFRESVAEYWFEDRDVEIAWHTSIRPNRAWQEMRRRASKLINPVMSPEPIEAILEGAEGFLDRGGNFYPIQQDWGHSDCAKAIALYMGMLDDCNGLVTPDQCFNFLAVDMECVVVRGPLLLQSATRYPLSAQQHEIVEALYGWRESRMVRDEYSDEIYQILCIEVQDLLRR